MPGALEANETSSVENSKTMVGTIRSHSPVPSGERVGDPASVGLRGDQLASSSFQREKATMAPGHILTSLSTVGFIAEDAWSDESSP